MRPIQLIMQAFGPYSQREEIDFSALGDSRLFLITGPTGSGKTTIFDGICYALYGETSGNIRAPEQLRSHLATPEQRTEVQLKFKVKNKVYHIHRIPRQEKMKARGQGVTEQKPEATLVEDDGGERKVITGITNVNERIEEIIGLRAEQFRQIMMIPQGDFQKLLVADSQEREKVLRQLFDTEIYRKFQAHLEEKSKQLYEEIKEIKKEKEFEVKSILWDDNSEMQQQKETNLIDFLVEVQQRVAQEEQRVKACEQELKDQQRHIEGIFQQKETAKKINHQWDLLVKLEEEILQLEQKADDIDKIKETIEIGKRAQQVTPMETNWLEKQVQIKELESQYKQCVENEEEQKKQYELRDKELKIIATEEAQREEEKNQLRQLQEYSQRIEGYQQVKDLLVNLQMEQKQINKEKERLEDICEKEEEVIIELKQEEEKGEKIKIQSLETREKCGCFQREIEKYEQVRQWMEEKEEKECNLRKLEEDFHKAEATMAQAKREYQQQQMEFFAYQAGYLARELKENMPCPVCGGTDHPHKAELPKSIVTKEALEQGEKNYGEKREKWQRLDEQCQSESKQLEVLVEKIRKGSDIICYTDLKKKIEVLQQQKDKLEHQYEEEEKWAIRCEEIKEKRRKKEESKKENVEKRKEKEKQWIAINQRCVEEKARLEQIESALPIDYRNKNELKMKMEQLQQKIEAEKERKSQCTQQYNTAKEAYTVWKTKCIESKKQWEAEDANEKKMYEKLQEEIKKHKFKSIDAFRHGKIKVEELEKQEKILTEYGEKRLQLQSQKHYLQKETEGTQKIDIDSMEKRYQGELERRKHLEKERSTLEHRCNHNKNVLGKIHKLTLEQEKKEEVYCVLGDVAYVSKGQNQQCISFERYVLAAFLEDVLTAANARLKGMTSGRYQLYRSEDVERKNKQSGLELQVLDQYTGQMRHVKTLSGGESFKTSLAMALALSDVVQSYSGGVWLDTMFIDEGFGTLDQESLDQAINALIDLQKNGRLIGIISHVQELKERIEHRLEIKMSKAGSRTQFVG